MRNRIVQSPLHMYSDNSLVSGRSRIRYSYSSKKNVNATRTRWTFTMAKNAIQKLTQTILRRTPYWLLLSNRRGYPHNLKAIGHTIQIPQTSLSRWKAPWIARKRAEYIEVHGNFKPWKRSPQNEGCIPEAASAKLKHCQATWKRSAQIIK